ncbi:MAG: glycosyltransferase family 4 protein [Chloroflexi bacterium]|nr:glycosyltransferase family 4 protein [Chloroflexota bacterium]MCI0645877.1 glycosyltransferase family 4 protein [Chloroflexota bacterium]MCI0725732.1 glycosyltransferase family 4 protein [Chloroflexota bacterium]
MNVAFVTIFDSLDMSRGSGTYYFMSREMERQGHTVYRVGPLDFHYPPASRAIRRLHQQMGKRYVAFLDPFVARHTGRRVARKLAAIPHDVIITNDVGVAGYTPTEKPLVLYTDVMITYNYAERKLPQARLSNLSPLSLWLCRQTIRQGIKRADLCVFPVQWVADEALKYHPAGQKVRVIPFGANIIDPGPAVAAGRNLAQAIEQNRIDLLFVGKDWARKGGDVAVAVTAELHRRGIQATLHCVGSTPSSPVDETFVRRYGLLDKANEQQRKQLYDLYRCCDAFILPSSSEGFVIVALEAAAFGLPSLAYWAMGVTDAVKDDQSGLLFPLGAPAETFAEAIAGWLQDPAAYSRLATGARAYYENSVNWQKAISTLFAEIEQWLAARPARRQA